MPELKEILPDAYAARLKRVGIVNAWNDPNFRAAVRDRAEVGFHVNRCR